MPIWEKNEKRQLVAALSAIFQHTEPAGLLGAVQARRMVNVAKEYLEAHSGRTIGKNVQSVMARAVSKRGGALSVIRLVGFMRGPNKNPPQRYTL